MSRRVGIDPIVAAVLLSATLSGSPLAAQDARFPPPAPAPSAPEGGAEARQLFEQAVADHLAAEQGAPDAEALLRRAAAGYSRALELKPGAVSALYNLGRAQQALGDLEHAAKAFELAASRPGSQRVFYLQRWAEFLSGRGRAREAAAVYEEVVLLEPRLEEPHAYLLREYLEPGLPESRRLLAYLWKLVAARQATRGAELALATLESGAPPHLDAELLTAIAASLAQMPQSPREILESPLVRRLARLRSRPGLGPGITELVELYARPGSYSSPFRWWAERYDGWVEERGVPRRDAFRAAMRAVGDWYHERGNAEVATACYRAAVDLLDDPDALALRSLANVYVEQRNLAALDALAASYADPAGRLFEAKNRAYMEGQLSKVLEYHRALGQIYGALAAAGKADWGSTTRPTTALFQLDRAFTVAQRLDAQASGSGAKATRIDPDLTLLYARGLEATGQRAREIDVRVKAAERFRAVGDERASAKVLQGVDERGLSEVEIRRIERYRGVAREPAPTPAPGPEEVRVETAPAWQRSVSTLTRDYSNPGLLAKQAAVAPRPFRLELPATVPWFDAGVDLRAGQRVEITASGLWSNVGPPAQGPGGIAGYRYPGTLVGSAPLASLVARVGTATFAVGERFDGPSPASGRLYLSINDTEGSFGDNQGALTVTITPR